MQEIFDAMQFSYSSYSSVSTAASHASPIAKKSLNIKQAEAANSTNNSLPHLVHLHVFSKRLVKKLQKASHVVLELRDFFRNNITMYQSRHQMHLDASMDPDDDDNDFDFDISEFEQTFGFSQQQYRDGNNTSRRLYLNTFIQACQSTEDQQDNDATDEEESAFGSSASSSAEVNYNRKQIQILNYLKTDQPRLQLNAEDFDSLNNIYSLHANAELVDKIRSLKSSLTNTHDVFELSSKTSSSSSSSSSAATASAGKLQLLGNHFKHIYFLSRSDSASDQSEIYFYDMNFRHLYVSAIKQKFVCLLLDIGSGLNLELIELTKSYGKTIFYSFIK